MRVTRLEIFGFKSFVDRFVLNFDENIIGIVGPNGCGKSNIVDSLRWVLGETHARQLRGNVFDDLIFNGSQTRRPLGMAEVSLTIRPRESWSKSNVVRVTAPGLAEDVVVTAEQLPQNGNGAETAEGTPELTDEWLSADELNERLESVPDAPALEPVDAAASGEAPATSFMDIPGLFQAEEIQLTRRLYRSGESEYFINRVPCRLRDMIEFYRLIGLGARGLSIVQQGQIAEIISRKPLERRELIEEAAGIAGFRARIEVAERKLEKTNTNIARLNDLVNEIEKQVRSLARQAKRARDRSELKAQLKDLELSIFRARVALTSEREANSQNALAGLERQFQELEERLSIHSAKNTESTAELEVWEQRIADVRLKRDRLMAEITQRQSERSERELALSRLEGRIRLVENNLRRIDERKEAIGVEIERRRIDFERFQVRQDEIQAKRGTAEERLKALESRENAEKTEHDANLEARIAAIQSELTSLPELSIEIAALEANTKRLREALRTENGATHEKRIRAASLESEIRSIQSQFQAFAEHVKKGAGLDDDAIEQSAPLLAKLRAPEHLQRPLAAVLGERGKYLVTQESRQLAERFQTKKERDKGSPSQFGVLDATYNGVAGRRDLPSTPTSGGRRILEELDIDGDVQSLMSALLGHVYLCTDIVQAQSVVAELAPTHGEVIAVTPDGEVVAPWGWHTTEGKGATFSFARVIEQRTTELQTVQAEHDAARERARGVELELARESERLDGRRAERDRVNSLQRELADLMRRLQEMERKARNIFLAEERQAQADLRRVIEELAGAERNMSYELKRIEELRNERTALDQETVVMGEDLGQLQRGFEQQRSELDSFLRSETSPSRLEAEEELRVLEVEIRDLDSKKSGIRAEVARALQEGDALRREMQRVKDLRGEHQLSVERAALERGMLLDDIRRYYGEACELPTESELSELRTTWMGEGSQRSFDEVVDSLQPEALSLRKRLEREGEVDPEAIEQYETERTRFESMKTQLDELRAASSTLQNTIDRLTEISRARFLATFEDVSQKFKELVPRLFGGGGGHLELVNPDDPLGSGIEVIVRPPGKKVRSIDLLSGGEKALTATAIIVAMFLHRPSPICVLDEVDAPLDDANLDRFLDLIREISKDTQFLMITHNKQSMASVDRLIGITMQESGVSTALTVSLDQAQTVLEQEIGAAA